MKLTWQFRALIAFVLPPWVPHAAAAVLLIGQHRQRRAATLEQGNKNTHVSSSSRRLIWRSLFQLTACLGVVSWKQRPLGLCLEGKSRGPLLWGSLMSDWSRGRMTTEVSGGWWTRTLNCTENRHRRRVRVSLAPIGHKTWAWSKRTVGRVGSLRQGQREHRVRQLRAPDACFPHQFQAVWLQRYWVDGLLVAPGSLGLLRLREQKLAESPGEAGRAVAVLPGEANSSIQTCQRTHNCRQRQRAEVHKHTSLNFETQTK